MCYSMLAIAEVRNSHVTNTYWFDLKNREVVPFRLDHADQEKYKRISFHTSAINKSMSAIWTDEKVTHQKLLRQMN